MSSFVCLFVLCVLVVCLLVLSLTCGGVLSGTVLVLVQFMSKRYRSCWLFVFCLVRGFVRFSVLRFFCCLLVCFSIVKWPMPFGSRLKP